MTWDVEYTDEFESWWDALHADEQDAIDVVVGLLEEKWPELHFPYSSKIKSSRHGQLRELRVQLRDLLHSRLTVPTNMRLSVTGSSVPWTRLLAELAVIVAGVLIALGVDSWWARQQERQHGEQYLIQLLADFQVTERRLRGAIEAETQRLEEVNLVIGGALNGSVPPADSLELPTGYNQFSPLVGTVTALIQGGDLRLLRSDSLRFELITYSALIDDINTMLRHTEHLIWNSTERVIRGRARHSLSPARVANAGRGWGQVDVVSALNDPEIISALQVQAMASHIRIFNLDRLEEPTGRVIRLIQAELR